MVRGEEEEEEEDAVVSAAAAAGPQVQEGVTVRRRLRRLLQGRLVIHLWARGRLLALCHQWQCLGSRLFLEEPLSCQLCPRRLCGWGCALE